MGDNRSDFEKYQFAAWRTMRKDLEPENQILNCALGLGEAGEVQDQIKKAIFHGHGFTEELKAKIQKELGDVLWYIAGMCTVFDWKLEDIAQMNIEKLEKRFPENKFSAERSINRIIEE